MVKQYADPHCWCTAHENCFQARPQQEGSDNKPESDDHIRAKFERWLFHIKVGRSVFVELPLKEGYGRPDLIVVDKGFVWAEEIVVSEKDASITAKREKYPFPISVIKVSDYIVPLDLNKKRKKQDNDGKLHNA